MARPSVVTAPAPPEPRFALAWAAGVFVLCALALGYPALAGQFLVNPVSDEYIAGFAFREYGATTLRETGGFPLWNPYLFGGLPFVAAMHGDIFYPTFLLRAVAPTDVAMTWTFIVHLFLAGIFTFGFLRAWGLGFYPALLGGTAYMLSGQIASLASPGHDGKLYVSALFPLTLWMIVRGVRDGAAWAWGVLALAVGLAVLSPHPQLLQYMLLASGAFALYVAFAPHDGANLERRTALVRLALALGAVLLGVAMGAIQYLPVQEYVDWSPRAGGKGWEHAVSFSMPPEELINTYLPQFTGILDSYWGRNGIHFHSEYLGAAVLLVAGMAFGRGSRKGFLWFWTGTLIVTLLWALGGYTPFYRLVYAIVPGTKFFRAPSTIFYVVALSVSVLAALGMEPALARLVGQRYLLAWVAVGTLVALLASAGALTGLALGVAGYERFDAVQANAAAVTLGAWRSWLFVLLSAGVLALLLRGTLPAHAAAAALTAVVAVDLWSVARLYWQFMPPAATIYAADPAIEHLKRLDQPARVLALQLGPTGAPNDPFLRGDALMTHRVRAVLGYHGNELGRYQVLYGKNEDMLQRLLLNQNFWRLTNTEYLLTNLAPAELARLPLPPVREVVGPVTNAAGSTVYLYRLPGDSPAAWVTPIRIKLPDDAVRATVLDPRFDVRRAALFDTSAAVSAQSIPASLPEPLAVEARVTHYAPGHISVMLDRPAPAGSALIVSENYYPGWRASVDGRPAGVGRADLTLIGVELPADARSVELRFRSEPYETGKAITLVAVALSALVIVGGIVLDRRTARQRGR